ncbi:hypothetical protein AAFF_G00116120 [Aldrovandia affinis]|uniref:Uncharacterized protein n=1 Tax=Aldrovandia affinis TaxID=143900 RepID=A0AAD7WWX8_9TELE|nr:hypothetical protein AAFF_G00116120 [Aldrovandia affinis]
MAGAKECFVDAYLDSNMNLHWDTSLSQPINQTLYQREGDPMLYVDEALTIGLNPIFIEGTPVEHSSAPFASTASASQSSRSSDSPTTLKEHQTFTTAQTLFLIDLMREYLTKSDANRKVLLSWVRRPEALVSGPTPGQNTPRQSTDATDADDGASFSTSSTTTATPAGPVRKRKKQEGVGGELLVFLKEAEAASQRRHDEHLEQMKASQDSIERMVQSIINKQ